MQAAKNDAAVRGKPAPASRPVRARNGGSATEFSSEIEATLGEREFRFLAQLVYDTAGIVVGPHKRNMVFSRLVRRLRDLGLSTFPAYCAFVQSPEGADEMGPLINAMTTNLTRFFREDHHFEFLAEKALPFALAEARKEGKRRLRLWSAGCSSGEEPYSIAITLKNAVPDLAQWDAKILATDLDTQMVARARAGIYPEEVIAELPRERREGHFTPAPGEAGQMAASADLRRLIAFKPLNLLGDWPVKGPFDAIFCRNVMIYFDKPTKQRLVDRLTTLLRPGGYLFVGHSETLLEHQSTLKLVGRTIYRRIA